MGANPSHPSLLFGWGTPESHVQTLDSSWRHVLSSVLFTFGKSLGSSLSEQNVSSLNRTTLSELGFSVCFLPPLPPLPFLLFLQRLGLAVSIDFPSSSCHLLQTWQEDPQLRWETKDICLAFFKVIEFEFV